MMLMNNHSPKSKVAATTILGLCLISFVIFDESPYGTTNYLGGGGRRSLMELEEESIRLLKEERQAEGLLPEEKEMDEEVSGVSIDGGKTGIDSLKAGIHPWARTNLVPLSESPDPERETALFWHIPKSGGTTGKEIYRCLGKRIEVLSQPTSISQAQESGLVPSGEVDLIFSMFLGSAIMNLFDEEHRGRMLAIFRHPVDRLISNFYYLQIATWERNYNPEWDDLSLLEWASDGFNHDTNHYVRRLVGKRPRDTVIEKDLDLAKSMVQSYFVVGLMNEMKESISRFNVVLGVDVVNDEKHAKCMKEFFPDQGSKEKKANSNPHPQVEKDDPAYLVLAEQNSLDIQLYEYIEVLFAQQKELIESYKLGNTIDGSVDLLPVEEE